MILALCPMLHALCLLKFAIRNPKSETGTRPKGGSPKDKLPKCLLPACPACPVRRQGEFVAGLPAESIFPLLPSSFSAINAFFEEVNYGSDHNRRLS